MSAEAPKRLGLRAATRLKTGRDFARVRQQGERLVVGCLVANWQRLPAGSQSRLGVITSAKVGVAVARSRARRLLRECYRLHQHELREPVELVLVARASISGRAFGEVEKDFLTALGKKGLLKIATGQNR